MSMIGKSLVHYEISSELGKGGMGEVYQAKDTKLGRDVAIKVLPEEFALDKDRVARFQREAKLLASLNHPNIAAIHGLEESEGTHFLVMELIEGDTLRDRIKSGAIPVEEALKLALQMTEALEAAHEKGVIHRDLKPANIKVTPEGKVKILDFGLAKAYVGDQENLSPMDSPTISAAATQQGVILGTAAYMSPEQARGKPVDRRADIWAFGVVFFEMLTGKQLFTGETVSDTLASVLAREPAWQSLPPNLHSRIRFLLERCLEKEAKDRYSGINDARVEIQKVLAEPGGVLMYPGAASEPQRKLRTILPWAASTLILGLIIAGLAVWNLRTPEPRQVMRFDYELPEDQEFSTFGGDSNLAVSPDGKQFVYSTPEGLYLRSVDELTAKLIAGTEGSVLQPFFSPDGKSIGYFSVNDRQLKKISISGGASVTLCSISQGELVGASWSANDTILFGQFPGDIMRVSANGGTPESLIKAKSIASIFPHVLPDGKSVLFTDTAGGGQARVMVQSLETGEAKELFAGETVGYLPTGHIVFGLPNDNNLFAVPFDVDTLEVKGGAVPIVEGVLGNGHQCAFSDAGTLVYIPGTTTAAESPKQTLVWVDMNGKEEPIAAPPNTYSQPKISPDGTRVALAVGPLVNEDIYIWDFVRETLTRLTFDKTREIVPIWTPDSKRILYYSNHENVDAGGLYWRAADGTGAVEKLCSDQDRLLMPWSISGDGKYLLIMELLALTHADIGMLSMEGDRTHKLLLQSEYAQAQPTISPDGRWMAYSSTESTGVAFKGDVFMRPFPDVDQGKWQVSTGGGSSPLWSPDGRELYYLSNENDLMVVSVQTEPSPILGTPKILFESTYLGLTSTSGTPYDIHPDGKRFLMIKPPASADSESTAETPRKIIIVTNWFEELKQRVSVD
jgi:serine/threonine protein kinase